MIYSRSVNAHPIEIFLVIMAVGSFAGIAGMIVAVPAYTALRVFAREFFYNFGPVRKMTSGFGKEARMKELTEDGNQDEPKSRPEISDRRKYGKYSLHCFYYDGFRTCHGGATGSGSSSLSSSLLCFSFSGSSSFLIFLKPTSDLTRNAVNM